MNMIKLRLSDFISKMHHAFEFTSFFETELT